MTTEELIEEMKPLTLELDYADEAVERETQDAGAEETVAAVAGADDGDDGGLSAGVVALIVLLALAVGGAVAVLATRGRRGHREPLEWDE